MAAIVQASGQGVLSNPIATPTSPGPSTQPTASDPLRVSDELWAWAYDKLRTREPELMEHYKKYLASLQHDSAADADVLTSRSVESIVKQLLDHRKKEQWRVSLLGHAVKIRQQVGGLVKFLLWSDPLVTRAQHSAIRTTGMVR